MDFVFELCMTPNKLIAMRIITASKRMYRDYTTKVNNLLLAVIFFKNNAIIPLYNVPSSLTA
ncbi:hypothetical protein GCM10023261_13600 [Bartonella jaculi]|uniref:Uncharacterized protein n=1 Tax=Bartonella jaculi TaxID=686226 RepID=A0ABP9N8W7_9HYPH